MTRATLLRGLIKVALTIPLTIGHFFYAWWVSMLLYHAVGGIRKQPSGWTEFGGAGYAWTIPLQLPGTLITRFGQWLCEPNWWRPNTWTALGTVLVLCASVLTAYALASLAVALITR